MTASRPGFSYRAAFLFALLFVMFLFSADLAEAQQVPRWEVFTGYSYMRFDSQSIGFAKDSNLNGGTLSGLWNITRNFGLTADTSANFGHEIKLYHFMIGPQYSFRLKNSTVFVHGLFGKVRDQVSADGGKTSIGKVFGGGAGYDWHYSDRFDIRVVEVDYLNGQTYGTTQKNVRVSTGIVFRFGGK
ncbi:MAG TPA: hypothetical protein VJQ82_08015 [Terriglobales bacterium]|nr:hypothetical protein [Terriglobales bacterium]